MSEPVHMGSARTEVELRNYDDGKVYFINPGKIQCPKCGVLESLMNGRCSSCGVQMVCDRKLAGKSETVEEYRVRIAGKKTKILNTKAAEIAAKVEAEEAGIEPVEEKPKVEEDDFHITKQPISREDAAIEILKKVKEILKEGSEIIGEFFSEVHVVFEPFNMNVSEKPKVRRI